MALLALRKFLKEEAKGHDRWIWQQCLQYSISLMNDLGIEVYSNWITFDRKSGKTEWAPLLPRKLRGLSSSVGANIEIPEKKDLVVTDYGRVCRKPCRRLVETTYTHWGI
jgi:hypothetical protein